MHFQSDAKWPQFHSYKKFRRIAFHLCSGEKIPTRSCLKELLLELCSLSRLKNCLGNRTGTHCGLSSESISSGFHSGRKSKRELGVRRTQPHGSLSHHVNAQCPYSQCCESLTLFWLPSLQQDASEFKRERQKNIGEKCMEGSERQGYLELSYMEAVSGNGTLKRNYLSSLGWQR